MIININPKVEILDIEKKVSDSEILIKIKYGIEDQNLSKIEKDKKNDWYKEQEGTVKKGRGRPRKTINIADKIVKDIQRVRENEGI